ncbi:glycoside hydrolase family 6 protein [Nocardioides sp. cx-173]|uniref:glycoside hydrolase family 6 protein n=1 Tax=Nocardioides sp. cx-173 TaxID=2898796 RepID=UPI001E56BB5E|nr:glycoside hydrolase family 6 protein [Nocardioides sp. cx-173]MCD4525288.1 glycoside hydrolase family 6 protein [Nocardioides sp. cx-173]UGB44082.1 glycoside hydrolase family 6 protein [Nocardioides sp. cx-173]
MLSIRRGIALVAAAALLLGGCASDHGADPQSAPPSTLPPAAGDPFADRGLYADPDSRARRAAAQAEARGDADAARVFTRLGETPSGIWLTPEELPAGRVGPEVARHVAVAAERGQVPTFVVYGIPDRDCTGGFSSGGLPADQYGPWVQEIADAVTGSVVVVEPDALASAVECENLEERLGLIGDAVDRLVAGGASTYLDGGHSRWIAPDTLADLLRRAGVDRARGFATNVSNYQTDEDERAYGEQLSALLGGASFVIDVGRNGRGSAQGWCNPPGRAYGRDPEAVEDGTALDAYLWVKPPGESDGECRNGPAAGEFWPERALELASASGW